MATIRPIFSVANETVRAAFRNRFVIVLLVLLAIVFIALPRAVGSDTSLEGIRRLALTATLGITAIILSAVTLWTGCSAIASEKEERTWSALSVTSASPFALWTGKWLGLVALDAVFLVLALVGVCLQLRLRGVAVDRLQPYERIAPTEQSLRENAARYYAFAKEKGALPADVQRTQEEWVDSIYQDLVFSPLSLSAGQSFSWDFPLFTTSIPGAEISLKLVSPFGAAAEIAGTLSASIPGHEPVVREIAPNDDHDIRLSLPVEWFGGDASFLHVEFHNTGAEEAPAALFHPSEDAVLYLPCGTFFGNLVRIGLVNFSLLATMAAIGLLCGALFSRPVAIFTATGLVILGLISHSNLNDEGIGCCDDPIAAAHPQHTYAMRARRVLDGIACLTAPVAEAATLDRGGDGLRISPRLTLFSLVQNGLAFPLLLGLASASILRRRDDA